MRAGREEEEWRWWLQCQCGITRQTPAAPHRLGLELPRVTTSILSNIITYTYGVELYPYMVRMIYTKKTEASKLFRTCTF